MTLIVEALDPRYAIQISDRRLTSNGVLITDEANKSLTFHCADGRFIVGYTGLARLANFNTMDWLLASLNDCAPPDFQAKAIVERLVDRASIDFASHPVLGSAPAAQKRLTIMFSGFLWRDGNPLAADGIITNFQDYEQRREDAFAWAKFRGYFRAASPSGRPFLAVRPIGAWAEFTVDDAKRVHQLLEEGRPARAAVDKISELIRAAADRPSSQGVIGKQLMTVILPADFSESAVASYYSTKLDHVSYMPDIVIATGPENRLMMKDIEFGVGDPGSSPPLVVPKQPRNQPCGCGSGKKYKRCHGR
jgi:hypothetical protein